MNIKYGWSYFGVVGMEKEWCVICTKARWHEKAEDLKVCLACCNVVEKEPNFQIERFIKEGV